MRQRDFVTSGVGLAGSLTFGPHPLPNRQPRPIRVIDAHCHAGKGFNFGEDKSLPAWTTWNDPERILAKAAEVGISQSIIFPISNTTYEKANEEIAGFVHSIPTSSSVSPNTTPRRKRGRSKPC